MRDWHSVQAATRPFTTMSHESLPIVLFAVALRAWLAEGSEGSC